ncbi:hypothetical protein [Bacteriovorax sp. Seq25_V]|nr:hypothetical protein [Bacteriovorax sp. Seq25_V]
MKKLILLFIASMRAHSAQVCVPAPSEATCLVLGGTYDASTRICCIKAK